MNKQIREYFFAVIGLIIIIVLIYLLYIFARKLAGWFTGLDNDVAIAIITMSGAVLLSFLSLAYSKYYELRLEIRKEHNNKKIPIYEKLIKLYFQVLFAKKAGEKPPSQQDMVKVQNDITQGLIIWASDDVIKLYSEFLDKSRKMDESEPDVTIMYIFEKFLLTLRKDLGHKDKKLAEGEILRLFLTDISLGRSPSSRPH